VVKASCLRKDRCESCCLDPWGPIHRKKNSTMPTDIWTRTACQHHTILSCFPFSVPQIKHSQH